MTFCIAGPTKKKKKKELEVWIAAELLICLYFCQILSCPGIESQSLFFLS